MRPDPFAATGGRQRQTLNNIDCTVQFDAADLRPGITVQGSPGSYHSTVIGCALWSEEPE